MGQKPKQKKALQEVEGIKSPHHIQQIKLKRAKLPSTKIFVEKIREGDISFLSRAITLIESTSSRHQKKAAEVVQACLKFANKSVRIGITGVPGVGKSTFIETLGNFITSAGKKVAVLAIDPTSTVNKGSILGDKTRMEALVKHKNAFIRPSPSSDSLGGVARKTRETIILCEAAGFDTIIIETVGVGQSETAVHSMVDFFLLLKLAGAGDELQGIKRGIIEMADAIVINKADGTNTKQANLAKTEFSRALHLYPLKKNGWQAQVLTCSAIKNKGIDKIWSLISSYVDQSKKSGYFEEKRNNQNTFWVLDTIEEQLKNTFYQHPDIKVTLKKILMQVENQKLSPFLAANQLLEIYKKS